MAETNYKISIQTEFDDQASPGLKKAEAQVISFADAAKKAGKDVSDSFNKTNDAAKRNSQAIATLSTSFKTLQSSIAAFSKIGVGVSAIFVKAVKDAAEFETTVKRLTTNLDLIGIKSKVVTEALLDQAEAIQKNSRFSDQSIISLQAMLVSFGLAPSKIKPTTQAIVDFAAATGKSLDEAGREVAQTLTGLVPRTGELRVLLQGLSEDSLKAGEGITLIGQRFRGAAAKDLETFGGAITQVKNAINDLFRSTGQIIAQLPQFKTALGAITGGIGAIVQGQKEPHGKIFEPDTGGRALMQGLGGPTRFIELDRQVDESKRAQQEIQKAEIELAKQAARQRFLEFKKSHENEVNDLEKSLKQSTMTAANYAEEEFRARKELLDQYFSKKEKGEKRYLELVRELDQKRQDDIEKAREKEIQDAITDAKKVAGQISEIFKSPAGALGTGIGALVGGAFGGTGGAQVGAAVGGMIPDIANTINSFLNQIPHLFSDIGNIVKSGLRASAAILSGGLSEIIPSIVSAFSGPDYFNTLRDAIAAGMDKAEFAKALTQTIESIRGTANQFRGPGEALSQEKQLFGATRRVGRRDLLALGEQIILQLTNDREVNLAGLPKNFNPQDILGVRIGGDFQKKLDKLSESLKEQAQLIVDITNLRTEQLKKELDIVNTALGQIKAARDAVAGGLMNAAQSAAQLREQFGKAKGAERFVIGGKLAGAIQSQFEEAKNLAAQGAISGEELARIQSASLAELDRLQAAGEKRAETLQDKIDTLNDNAKKQVDALADILQAIKDNDIEKLIDYFKGKRSFASGISYVPSTGPAIVHEGETIIPKGQSGGITININGVGASGTARNELTNAVRDILIRNLGNVKGLVKRAAG